MNLSDLTNAEIVVLALASLGGASKRCHTEEVAEKLMEISPSRFGFILPKYKERKWPDTAPIHRALCTARAKGFVDGVKVRSIAKDGWRLTVAGVAYAKNNEAALNSKDKDWIIPKNVARITLGSIKKEKLFKMFLKNELKEANPYDFLSLLEISPSSTQRIAVDKLNRLRAIAELMNDKKVISFLDAAQRIFGSFICETLSEVT